MKKIYPLLIGLLLILVGFFGFLLFEGKDKQSTQNNDVFIQRLDSIQSELEASRGQRDSLILRSDSVNRSNDSLSTLIIIKDKQISFVPGRYKNVEADSLSKLMNGRVRVRKVN